MEACFAELALHKALIAIWEFINVTNKYIVEREPWVLAKDPANQGRLETIIYNLLEALRITAVLISPFMPGSARKIMDQLGIADVNEANFESLRTWGGLKAGNALKRGEALFPRVEFKKEEDGARKEVRDASRRSPTRSSRRSTSGWRRSSPPSGSPNRASS